MIEPLRKLLNIQREISPKPFVPPVFLTGCMRSGTTFLAHLLTEHPQLLHLEGELINVWSAMGGMDCEKNRIYLDRKNVTPEFTANMAAHFERSHLEFRKTKYNFWRWVNKTKRGSGGLKKDWNGLRLFNKNVHFINRTDYLLEMFPQSKVILIIRPIEAQVNSIKLHFEKSREKGKYFSAPQNAKHSWITGTEKTSFTVKQLTEKWVDLNKTAIEDLQRNNPEQYFILDYNKMVNAPEKSVADIYKFLGLPPHALDVNNTLDDRKTFNTHTSGNPTDDWKTRLTAEEKATIEAVKKERKADCDFIESNLI